MKKYLIGLSVILLVTVTSCKKSSLQLVNPNAPTIASLSSEAGLEAFALGIFQKQIANVQGEGISNIWTIALFTQSIMGDEVYCPYGNFGWRYAGQVYAITLPPPYNTKIINPIGNTQYQHLQSTNSRQSGELNDFLYEWQVAYLINLQANILLSSADKAAYPAGVNAAERRAIVKAWAYWWKGIIYSRLGSIYSTAIINNATDGTTNNNFLPHDAIITEANANFDKAAALLKTVSNDGDYQAVMTAIIPTFDDNIDITTPTSWLKHIATYEARNYLVNHKVATMTATDWTNILTLANNGLTSDDNEFKFGQDPSGNNDISANFFHPFSLIGDYQQFGFVSERLIQDFKPGDARLAKGFVTYASEGQVPQVNTRSRGLQFGTRWDPVNIEDGGLYATSNSTGYITYAGSWEENSLMIAEADIHTGNIEAGLALVDAVRDAQGAGIAHVAGTGLNQAAALEELRKERRVGLFLRGLAFYDARRWGVTAPAANGGGRANAIVEVQGIYINSASAQPLPCFMEYNYLDYYDVPANETDFNAPATGTTASSTKINKPTIKN